VAKIFNNISIIMAQIISLLKELKNNTLVVGYWVINKLAYGSKSWYFSVV